MKSDPLSSQAISVIVVTYNSAHCVGHALAAAPRAAELIVVDNASTDDTIEQAKKFPCRLIANDSNRGFGAACNQGAQVATGEFLLFLNPDAVLAPGAAELLLAVAAANPAAVAFGPRHQLAEGQVTGSGGRKPPPGNQEVLFLSGAALLCRKSAFAKVAGFDEQFFLYFEDQDLCLRLAKLGPLVEVGEAVVYHHPGKGARLDTRQRFTKYRNYGHSRAYFSRKHGERFRFGLAALEQTAKGLVAIVRADHGRAAQHFGRAVGYVEGRYLARRHKPESAP
jgi:N-acetylglucosaminyl-diphospho-decaprenol L-rhamnosyltransferase